MGNYATNRQLIDRGESSESMAHLTKNAGGAPDQDVLTEAIQTAEAFIDSKVAMRYDTPVDVTADDRLDKMLKGATLDLAMYNLMSWNGLVPDSIKSIYDRVVKWLDNIAAGKAVLPGSVTPATTAAREPRVKHRHTTDSRIFTRANVSSL